MTDRLRVLWAWLTGDTVPRCHDCRQRILGSYASDMNAPVTHPVRRHWPACPPGP